MKGEGGERNAEAIDTFLRLSFIGERYKFEENICLGLFKQVSAPEIKTQQFNVHLYVPKKLACRKK